ncbi:MAG TPA: hypothetical protein ENJ82_03540 [Bacteroidetes bacterium]|nr:hypothetical protein [Bacteroidota bacterium]
MALVHDFNDLLNIAGLSPFQKTVIRENVLMLRLMISRVSVTRTDYFEAIEEIEGFISTKRENISEDFLYRISFACTEGLLLFGELSLAAKWIVRIQKSKQSPFRPGISAAAWMMYFLIRYEQGAWDILRSQLSGGKAYLNKYEAGNEYYTALFSFFENAAKLNGNIGKKEFSSLHSTLHDLIEHPQYALLENYFYFSAWLVSKIQGLPFLSFMEDS